MCVCRAHSEALLEVEAVVGVDRTAVADCSSAEKRGHVLWDYCYLEEGVAALDTRAGLLVVGVAGEGRAGFQREGVLAVWGWWTEHPPHHHSPPHSHHTAGSLSTVSKHNRRALWIYTSHRHRDTLSRPPLDRSMKASAQEIVWARDYYFVAMVFT